MPRNLVWSRAYRIDHWVRAAAVASLVFTGFYIHSPFFGPGPGDLAMAWVRWGHFLSANVLILGLIVRVYLAFNSRFDADWRDFGILKNLRGVPAMASYYFFLRPDHPQYRRYNPLQALTYVLWLLLLPFMALTGFAVYKGQFFGLTQSNTAFLWVTNLLGGESAVRLWHFLGMWVFLATIVIHVYAAVLASWWMRDGTLSSIFTGYKETKETGV